MASCSASGDKSPGIRGCGTYCVTVASYSRQAYECQTGSVVLRRDQADSRVASERAVRCAGNYTRG